MTFNIMKNSEFLQKCFTQAVFDVFATAVGVEPGAVDEKSAPGVLSNSEITGAMIVLSERNALLTMTMSKQNAAAIVSCMTGIDQSELIDEELYDGVAELVNMIAGRAKALLAGTGDHYQITPPLTIVGENHFIVYKAKTSQISMDFATGESHIRLNLTYF